MLHIGILLNSDSILVSTDAETYFTAHERWNYEARNFKLHTTNGQIKTCCRNYGDSGSHICGICRFIGASISGNVPAALWLSFQNLQKQVR